MEGCKGIEASYVYYKTAVLKPCRILKGICKKKRRNNTIFVTLYMVFQMFCKELFFGGSVEIYTISLTTFCLPTISSSLSSLTPVRNSMFSDYKYEQT